MKSIQLTVFTEPVAPEGFVDRMKNYIWQLKFVVKSKALPPRKQYGGSYAVTRSLVEGLKKSGATYNYNPESKKSIYGNVVVLAGVERLKDAIRLKKKGRIQCLLAGPNIVDDVRSENQLVADPAIDYYIVPSEWVKRLVLNDCDHLKGRVVCWPAGVDATYWSPGDKANRDRVLIYWKTEPEAFYREVIETVESFGMRTLTMKAGDYTLAEYKQHLGQAQFAIFISRSESQGIALAEAWAMDVPTFVFDPGEFFFYGRMIHDVSSCPYLTRSTGLTWKTIDELKDLLNDNSSFTGFAPRDIVLKEFTDEHCAGRLLKIIEDSTLTKA